MTKLNKIFAVLTAFIILVSSFCLFTVSAASIKYSATSASGQKGDTVTINVTLSSGVELWGSIVKLSYNSSELQYVSHSNGSLISSGKPFHEGSSITFAGSLDTAKAKKGGTIFSVKFKILKDSGSSSLKVSTESGSNNIDYDGNEISATTSNGTVTVTVPVTSIKLDKSSVTLKKGETSQLTATVSPDTATNKTVTYTSSNSKVAKVSSSGKITAVGGGTATITAKAGGKTVTCKVTVSVTQTGISHSGNATKTIEQGDSLKLSVSKVPSDTTDSYTVTWSVADTSIATVTANGTVKGVAVGETTVTAKSNGWSVVYKINVVEKVTESSTDESSTEESTSEIPTEDTMEPTESTTEPTTAPTTTEPSTTQGLLDAFKDEINNPNSKVTSARYYITMLIVALVTGAVVVPVTFLATSGYYKSKLKKENENEE